MPTLFRSRLASAQKHPCAFRYSGQIPGCMTNVPLAEIEKTLSFSNTLQRARTRSGFILLINVSVS